MKIRVLIVDDHALFRDGMRYVLHQLADKVEILDTGDIDEAFRLADANPDLDLVLMDLHMPGSYGVATVAHFMKIFQRCRLWWFLVSMNEMISNG